MRQISLQLVIERDRGILVEDRQGLLPTLYVKHQPTSIPHCPNSCSKALVRLIKRQICYKTPTTGSYKAGITCSQFAEATQAVIFDVGGEAPSILPSLHFAVSLPPQTLPQPEIQSPPITPTTSHLPVPLATPPPSLLVGQALRVRDALGESSQRNLSILPRYSLAPLPILKSLPKKSRDQPIGRQCATKLFLRPGGQWLTQLLCGGRLKIWIHPMLPPPSK